MLIELDRAGAVAALDQLETGGLLSKPAGLSRRTMLKRTAAAPAGTATGEPES
jgi:hypothetical protein